MNVGQLVDATLERNEAILFQAVGGLTPEELRQQPGPESNPIGWLLWHLTRTQDNHVSAMVGKEHAWATGGWHARFGMEPDPSNRGRGHTSEQVAAFSAPDLETLLDHYRAVRAYTKQFLQRLTLADLDRPVPAVDGDGTVPLSTRLQMMVLDNIQHSGQIAYLRGLIRGKGWFDR